MANTIGTGGPGLFPHRSLNSDGQRHPLLNATAIGILVVGLASFSLGLFIRADPSSGSGVAVLTAATGLAALLIGLFAQMISATREERIIIVAGIIAGFVGLALGLAHGGFAG
jgi:FtsH-binding integral membrane protein